MCVCCDLKKNFSVSETISLQFEGYKKMLKKGRVDSGVSKDSGKVNCSQKLHFMSLNQIFDNKINIIFPKGFENNYRTT